MSSIVIVTQQCYLLCESINYIAINEVQDEDDGLSFIRPKRTRRTKKSTKAQIEAWKKQQFQIIIDFIPVGSISQNNNISRNNSNTTSVNIRVTGRDRCLDLFAHMVQQIREQIPDNKFLDEIVEKFIQENN